MKYKVGDEVLVKCKIIGNYKNGRYKVTNRSNPYADLDETDGVRHIFPTYDEVYPEKEEQGMTADEAWEIAKKLFADYSDIELDEIFGKGWSYPKLMEMIPHEVKEKIESWESKKVIKVGDEVVPKESPGDDDCKFFVTYIDDDNSEISGFSGFDGDVFFGRFLDHYQKTGRHIDMELILKQIIGCE